MFHRFHFPILVLQALTTPPTWESNSGPNVCVASTMPNELSPARLQDFSIKTCDVCIVDKLIGASDTQNRLLDIPACKYQCPGERGNGTSPPQHVARHVPLLEKGRAHTHFEGFKCFLDLSFLLLCHSGMPSQGPNAYLDQRPSTFSYKTEK